MEPRHGRRNVEKEYIVEGNTVRERKRQEKLQLEEVREKHAIKRNRDKAAHMNLSYLFFLTCAMIVTGIFLLQYVSVQADVTNSIKHISRLERKLNDLTQSNDEEYSRITSDVDLEEVKRIAIYELGMQYAQEGQIITFHGNGSDYVRQFSDMK